MPSRLLAGLLLFAVAGVALAARDSGEPEAPPALLDEGPLPLALAARSVEVQGLPLDQRMAAISELMLGVAYQVDAVGEGRPPDLDPPARYDAFDCLTFVEEVLALSLAGAPSGAAAVRQALRYGPAEPRYETRRHFMLSQWVPGAIADGWLVDITEQLGPASLIEKQIAPSTWAGWRRRALFQLPDDKLPVGRFELPVLSVDAVREAAADLPAGALLLTVRQSREGVPMVVTHLGFLLPAEPGQPRRVRHATKMRGLRVMDHSLDWYLEHLRWYDRWPVAGINVLMPQEQGPRRSRLPG